ncbi:MAG: PfkB family carbohydrate kinase [Pseudomonadota bacterium]
MTIVLFGEALVDDFGASQAASGAPFNVARTLAAFMAPQLLITRIGSDRNGAVVRAECERFAMSERGIQTDPIEATGRVVAERFRNGYRMAVQPNQAYDFIDADEALAALATVAPALICFGTLAQRSERSRATLAALLEASEATRVLDLNLRPGQVDQRCVSESLHAADIAKVNEAELQTLFEWFCEMSPSAPAPDQDTVRAACRKLMQMFSLRGLIVTLGHRGAVYFGIDGATIESRDNPAPAFVLDTAGAGDAFCAVFLLGSARGWPLEQTLARANEFAGAICTVAGAIPQDINFYDKWAALWRN